MASNLTVGVDASRNRSGGAVAHICGLMSSADPRAYGISRVHLWAYESLMDKVPEQPWLVKHSPPELRGPITQQLWWQLSSLPKILDQLGCDIVFNTDAGSVCPASRSVTLSQDMLCFEAGEIERYGLSLARLRLEVLKHVQLRSIRRAKIAMFLTEYARNTIEGRIDERMNSVVVPHGVADNFRAVKHTRRAWPTASPVRTLYVSNVAPYKHQWHVVAALAALRAEGYPVELMLVGGGSGRSQRRLEEAQTRFDPRGEFVTRKGQVSNDAIPALLTRADLFVFASSCENLPITMLEAMASGIPICSSNRGPMPELLGPDGVYFDPEVPDSIAMAVRSMLDDASVRSKSSANSLERSKVFTWSHCSQETWKTLASACRQLV